MSTRKTKSPVAEIAKSAPPVSGKKKNGVPKDAVSTAVAPKVKTTKVVSAKVKATAKKPAVKAAPVTKVAGPKVKVFQIYFRPEQKVVLDPAFAPYNNEGDASPLLEYNVFKQLAKSGLTKGLNLWGAVSWKFAEKTRLPGKDLLRVIAQNPGYDVYFCNPSPEVEGLFHNLWLQGETAHPNFLALSHAFFQAVDWPVSELTAFRPSAQFSSANYFVGTPVFWARFIEFIDTALAKADKRLPAKVKALLYSSAADAKLLHNRASYLPFIVERAFGIFMATHGAGLKSFKYGLPAKVQTLNLHQRLLGEMKDAAYQSKSAWLATCWVNYRNLYLAQSTNKDWLDKNLKRITPTKIVF